MRQTLYTVTAIVSVLLLTACSQARSGIRTSDYFSGQPGMVAISSFEADNVIDESDATDIIETLSKDKRFRHLFSSLPSAQFDVAASVLLNMQNGDSIKQAIEKVAARESADLKWAIISAFVLFPLDRYALYLDLQSSELVETDALHRYADVAGIYIPEQKPGDLSGYPVVSTSLIESMNISIFGQTPDTTAQMRFRQQGQEIWKDARAPEWEPVQSVLTGPILYLEPDTTYEIEVTLNRDGDTVGTYARTVTTRPDSPPVDPDNIHYLRDIYTGGTLDLEALGIEGKPGAWAKIVGDADTPVVAEEGDRHAIAIGDNSYVYFENVTTKGARVHAVYAENAHHLWFKGCDISEWGRQPNVIKNGIAFEEEDAQPINYDSALYFVQSGVITVEDCHVHSPTPAANSWEYGHPKGPNAFLAYGNHQDPRYKGQIILRNNRFTGAPEHRFNDVIEGRKNGETLGGFVRHSAIYNNTLAYANDDAIEIDGGQHNVLVYNNDISNTYTGISAVPSRLGPSFIFNNYIHDLGDERGKQWAAVKLGGLIAGPMGKVNIFHNFITVERNGITASRFKEDDSFWINATNNVVITEKSNNMVGYNVYDPEAFPGSLFINNVFYNLKLGEAKIEGNLTQPYVCEASFDDELAHELYHQDDRAYLPATNEFVIDNFTRYSEDGSQFLYGLLPE